MKKRIVALFLCFVMMFLGASCSSLDLSMTGKETEASGTDAVTRETGGIHNNEGFATGYAIVDITPTYSVPLAGFGNQDDRYSKTVESKLYATCVAISDGEGGMFLLFSLDLGSLPEPIDTQARKSVAKAIGIPEDHVALNTSHTHSAVDANHSSSGRWLGDFYKKIITAATEAVADLDKTEVSAGTTQTEGFAFVRRYIHANGKASGPNFDYGGGTPIVSHESEADREMRFLRFKRENQKDILLVNWQSHYIKGSSSDTEISSDYPGAFRNEVEKEGYLFAFYQGGAGNMALSTKLEGETSPGNHKDVGKKMAAQLFAALPEVVPIQTGPIKVSSFSMTLTVDHTRDAEAGAARDIQSAWDAKNLEVYNSLCAKYGFASHFEANSIVSKAAMGPTGEAFLSVFSFGEVSFAFIPFEPFDATCKEIREASPFQMTFACGYANGKISYAPTSAAFDNGGYEVTSFRFVKGTAELVRDQVISMLNDLKSH